MDIDEWGFEPNHDKALIAAKEKSLESNLARAYLDLREQMDKQEAN
jgi:hypothetical protein